MRRYQNYRTWWRVEAAPICWTLVKVTEALLCTAIFVMVVVLAFCF